MRFLLDTCLLSELVKPKPHPGVLAWLQDQDETSLFVSAITLAEWLASVKLQFSSRVLAFTGDTAGYWALMCAQAEALGKPMAAFDSLIAATALEHGLSLVTRNVGDFAGSPVVLVNPWSEASA